MIKLGQDSENRKEFEPQPSELDNQARQRLDGEMIQLGTNKNGIPQKPPVLENGARSKLDDMVVKGLTTQKLDGMMVRTMGKGPGDRSTQELDQAMLQTLKVGGGPSTIEKYMFSNEALKK